MTQPLDFLYNMSLEDWKDFVSTSATITTVINFITGLQVHKNIFWFAPSVIMFL